MGPYTQEIRVTLIDATEIEWKPGKKAKQKKEKEEPRPSIFRDFFRSMKPDMDIPDDVNLDEEMMEDDDEEGIVEMLMENDHEIGCALRDQIIPFGVRWYTGEAAPEDDDDEDGDDDDDDDDDESDPSPGAKKKGGKASK